MFSFFKKESQKKVFNTQYNVWDIVSWKVISVKIYWVKVDISCPQEGFIHLTEVSWQVIEDIHSVIKEGQQIDAKIIGVDKRRNRILLSIKDTI